VHTIEDALARISHLQHVQPGPSGFSVASQQVFIEVLPPILVLHLKRFLYDAAADSTVKINKPVQFAPELEIPVGMIFSLVSPC
jgi:ubiquitin carboxyl-terminal hydrolase 10